MRILVDEDIPFARETFADFPDVRGGSGHHLTRSVIGDADVLVVSSITPVNSGLLDGAQVRFVGSATIGTDHIDMGYLRSRKIDFVSAPGSNSRAVAEYVLAALVHAAVLTGRGLQSSSLGIVGAGHCGSYVAELAGVLGMQVLLNDPPLARQTGDPRYVPLEKLYECDFLTFHVPLTRGGSNPTYHMVDCEFLMRLKRGAVLINSCRGAVIDEKALGAALDSGHLAGAVCDVWENEPCIDRDLLERVMIGTPHVAGHSQEGKARAIRMVRDEMCLRLNLPQADTLPEVILENSDPCSIRVPCPAMDTSREELLGYCILNAVPIIRDDAELRSVAAENSSGWGPIFDSLRKNYRHRREFGAFGVSFAPGCGQPVQEAARLLGFGVEDL